LYHLTAIACYTGGELAERSASFEMFLRHIPEQFGYVIAKSVEAHSNKIVDSAMSHY
jgi:nicotinate phosphoribosyltransferase